MKRLLKFYLLPLIAMIPLIGTTFAIAPSFDNNFAQYLTNKSPDQYGRVETVFSFSNCINRNKTIIENMRNLFYPSTFTQDTSCSNTGGWLLRDVIRVVTFGIIFVFIVVAGINFIMNGSDADGPKKSAMSIVYIGYGAFLVFGVIWILGYVLNIEWIKGSVDLVNNVQNNLFLQILGFFKVFAFFLAIIMMVVTGFKMMAAMDKADKAKAGAKWIINIIVALVLIKIIDYVFYIAQVPEFAQKASDLVLSLAKILGWFLGIISVLGLFYAGYSMFLSGGDEKAMKKTKGIVVNIFVASLVVFFFLLIVYQIFNEFVK